MANHLVSSLPLLLLTLLSCTKTTLAKTHHAHAPAPAPSHVPPAAPAPSPLSPKALSPLSSTSAPPPATPPDIIAVLDKPGKFSALIRLLRTTQVDDRITKLLGDPSQGLTLFAPNDGAFSRLRAGILNSLSDAQQVQLVLFHMLSSYFPLSQFQTSSNPLHTEAGDNANGDFPLNVTTSNDQVNLTSGIDSAMVTKTVYTDGQLAVYEVDEVLLPSQIFASLSSVFGPPKAPKEVESAGSEADSDSDGSPSASGGAAVSYSVAVALGCHLVFWFGGAVLVGV